MRLSWAFLSAIAIPSVISAGIPVVPPVGDFADLHALCEAGGPDTCVGVQYVNGLKTTFKYNECLPYEFGNNGVVDVAVFCKPATCFNNPNPGCTGGTALPLAGIPAVDGLIVPNSADWAQLVGQGGLCQRNGL